MEIRGSSLESFEEHCFCSPRVKRYWIVEIDGNVVCKRFSIGKMCWERVASGSREEKGVPFQRVGAGSAKNSASNSIKFLDFSKRFNT